MLAQIRYAFWDISDNLLRFIINFVQIMVSILLIAYAILKITDLNSFKANMSYLDNLENTYIMTDITDQDYYDSIIENDENLPKVREFYDYLKNSDEFSSYTCYSDYVYQKDGVMDVLSVDANFISVFNLKDENGNSLEGVFSRDYGDYIPIILGRGYHDRYEVGDIIEYNNGNLIVSAFLARNSFYYQLSWDKNPISLDAEIICPAMAVPSDYIVNYLIAIEGTRIITEDSSVLDEIASKSKELGLLDFNFKSLETQVNNIRNDDLQIIQSALLAMGLILSLCAACMTASLLTFVEEHLKEFAIHLLSGATILSIIGRILIQVGIPIVLANIVAYIAFRDVYVSMRLLLTSVALCVIITVIPIVKISILGINGILKRCE